MAKTTTTRFKLQQWSAQTDTFVYTELNNSLKSIEDLAAIDKQGTKASRPAAGVRGTYYFATDEGILYRDSGTAWVAINDYTSIVNRPELLELGNTSTTAAAGNHTHAWTTITGRPTTSTIDGRTIHVGDSAPASSLGVNGDIYLEY